MMYMHHMSTTIRPQAIIEVCLCHHARRAARAITRGFDEALQPLGLKANQFNILAAIGAGETASATEVATVLAMDRTTLSRNLKPLRQAGYLASYGGAGRRPDTLALTTKGKTLLSEATSLWQQAQSQLTHRLGTAQAGQLLQSLEAATRCATTP